LRATFLLHACLPLRKRTDISASGDSTGDGTGKILGIDSGIEAIVFLSVFTLIWVLYFNSQKDLDDGRDGSDDGGLSL